MDLTPGKCDVCCEESEVLSQEDAKTFKGYMKQTFSISKKEISSMSICVCCAHNICLSHSLKNNYRKLARSSKIRLQECFVCSSKGPLVKTNCNPGHFKDVIGYFMKAVNSVRSYEKCCICMQCVCNLKIWYSLHCKFDSTSPTPVKAGKEASDIHKAFLDNGLKHLVPIKKLQKVVFKRNIRKDTKMFKQIPYVFVGKTSQISNDLLSKNTKTNKSSSQIENAKRNTPPETPSKVFNQSLSNSKKNFYKIRLKDSKAKPKSPRLSINIIKQSYICPVCCKHFNRPCDLKMHTLQHEKPGKLIVKLIREQANFMVDRKGDEFTEEQESQVMEEEREFDGDKIRREKKGEEDEENIGNQNVLGTIVENNDTENGEKVNLGENVDCEEKCNVKCKDSSVPMDIQKKLVEKYVGIESLDVFETDVNVDKEVNYAKEELQNAENNNPTVEEIRDEKEEAEKAVNNDSNVDEKEEAEKVENDLNVNKEESHENKEAEKTENMTEKIEDDTEIDNNETSCKNIDDEVTECSEVVIEASSKKDVGNKPQIDLENLQSEKEEISCEQSIDDKNQNQNNLVPDNGCDDSDVELIETSNLSDDLNETLNELNNEDVTYVELHDSCSNSPLVLVEQESSCSETISDERSEQKEVGECEDQIASTSNDRAEEIIESINDIKAFLEKSDEEKQKKRSLVDGVPQLSPFPKKVRYSREESVAV